MNSFTRVGALLLLSLTGACLSGQATSLQQRWLRATATANVEAKRGNYAGARLILETAFRDCDQTVERTGCRIDVATSLGDMLRAQANQDRRNRDTLFREAAGFYDSVLNSNPDRVDVLYKKALAFRSMGVHEWQEPFFRTAPSHAGDLQDVFLSFQGDYFAGHERWQEAETSYRMALAANPDQPGARQGLIDALHSLGGVPNTLELLRLGRQWELQDPGAAADAHGAALAVAFSRSPSDSLTAQAMVGLVSIQANGGRTVGEVPPEVPTDWIACKQLRDFLESPRTAVTSWWLNDSDRRTALGLAALARGRQLVSRGRPADAEVIWQAGARLATPGSGTLVDLERELAMLYFTHSRSLDLSGAKFRRLEQEMFAGKGAALATGDLESAQRFHTALGLIYAARGIFVGPPARNAVDQLTWALETAQRRRGTEGFYQPLASIREALAQVLDTIGSRERAREAYLDAAAAYFDIDDFQAAIRSLVRARAVPDTWPAAPTDSLAAFREEPCRPDAQAAWHTRFARFGPAFRAPDFRARQSFKMAADCARLGFGDVNSARNAFRLVDSSKATLIGAADVGRLTSVLRLLLRSVGVSLGEARFERVSVQHSSVAVSYPGETQPLWFVVPEDDMIAARVVTALGGRVLIYRLQVRNGFVDVYSGRPVPESTMQELRRVTGVRDVRMVSSGQP